MQQVGIQLCAIPAEELTVEALNRANDGPASSSS